MDCFSRPWSVQEPVRFAMLHSRGTTVDRRSLNVVPTRLFALKHGATLVWGPEMVDKAILHAERVVDRKYPILSLLFARLDDVNELEPRPRST